MSRCDDTILEDPKGAAAGALALVMTGLFS